MKKKKKFLVVIIVALLALAAILIVFNFKNSTLVTVTFDVNGGTPVSSLKVEKGSTITIPSTTKKGYNFLGWYIGDKKVDTNIKVDKNVKVKAKWEEIPEGVRTFTIKFDSRGGTDVESLTFECNKEITLPSNPSRKGYTFISWVDENKTPILDQALLECDDITLYANWEKEEEKKEEKKEEKPKEYTCSEGTLEGTKCIIEGTVHTSCPEGTKVDGEKCVKTSDYNKGNRTCPVKTVQTTASHTETLEGEYFQQGAGYCGYYVYKTLTTKAQCDAAYDKNTVWANNKCYAKIIINGYETTCSEGYEWYNTQQLAQWNIHDGGLCLRIVEKVNYCDEGFALNSGRCIKTIDATVK